jgi:hypothetical protein
MLRILMDTSKFLIRYSLFLIHPRLARFARRSGVGADHQARRLYAAHWCLEEIIGK